MMKLVITIDVEEDNWSRYSATDNPVSNVERLVGLQALFDRYGARPTYLLSYPVATTPESVTILKRLSAEGRCELGMHCHPWNTPPFDEEITDVHSMLCNLPDALVERKLTVLHDTICKNFGCSPVSFRAGRWGFGPAVARTLCKLGYRVDTSVSPYEDWRIYHGPDYSGFQLHPYRFEAENISLPMESGTLFEVPTSVGFLQEDFDRCRSWMPRLDNGVCRMLHLKGILGRLRVLNKVWLSPELSEAGAMIELIDRLCEKQLPVLNMSFHSTSLKAGLAPFVTFPEEEADFLKRIEAVLAHARNSNFEFLTLDEYERFEDRNAFRASCYQLSANTPCLGASSWN